MYDAVMAVRAERAALLEIGRSLGPAQWTAQSGCPGWSVKDLFSHLAAGFWTLVDPSRLPDVTGRLFEQAMEIGVAARRGLSPEVVLADYDQVSTAGLEILAGLVGIDAPVPLPGLGTYPLSLLPHAYAFDHFVHIQADLFAPRGPLHRTPPAADEMRIGATLDWIEAALPQQNATAVAQATVEIQVTGVAARTITFGTGPAKATVSSDAAAFTRWVTHRGSWAELGAQATGDEPALAVARSLKVI